MELWQQTSIIERILSRFFVSFSLSSAIWYHLVITSTFFRLWFSKNLQLWLYPNWFIYLFLAVFAFSSPFCYAKTAFSYSRALLSPCTPVLFMVKDVVKSEYRMIVMWSWFWGGRSDRKRSAGREGMHG